MAIKYKSCRVLISTVPGSGYKIGGIKAFDYVLEPAERDQIATDPGPAAQPAKETQKPAIEPKPGQDFLHGGVETSPDGAWSVRTIAPVDVPELAIFSKGATVPTVFLHRNLESIHRLEVKWSSDSTKVVVSWCTTLTAPFIVAAGLTALSGRKALRGDADSHAFYELVQKSGGTAPHYKFEARSWRNGYRPIPSRSRDPARSRLTRWSLTGTSMQIVPGSYPLGCADIAVGALKFTNYQY